ncbi:hypothetical protein GW17_00038065 [Ensete ventricosum]|nr:hypothetical protein GW17_00038065 [Ensete ventricosum]
MARWYVETIALSLLSIGRSMMTLYVEGSPTMMNDTINVFNLGSSPIVIGRVIVPIGKIESPVNLVNVDVTRRSEGWASSIPRTLAANRLTNWASGSSLPYVRPRSDAVVGLGWELA